MTEPVPEGEWDVDVEVDELLASIAFCWGTDDIPEARQRLRRALMYSWYDGQSSGLNGYRHGVDVRPNPWVRSTK